MDDQRRRDQGMSAPGGPRSALSLTTIGSFVPGEGGRTAILAITMPAVRRVPYPGV
jgi:hypothetical protein